MTQLKHFSAGLMALGVSLALQGGAAAATDAAPAFRILSDEEMAAHSAIMNSLQGEARDQYRNAQYEQLKQRALDNGFRLPATPPWATQTAAGPAPGAAPAASIPSAEKPDQTAAAPAVDAAAEAAARHAAMREKLQAQQPPLAPQPNTDPALENLKELVSAQQRQVDAGRMAAQQAAPAAAEPRFAPVEEITAAQAIATPPAPAEAPPAMAEAPPAAPPAIAEVAPAAPPAKAEAPPAAPTAPAAQPLPPMPPEPVAAPPGAYPVGSVGQTAAEPMDSDAATAGDVAATGPDADPAYGGPDAMGAYRESMRARFDEYMRERQAQHEETMRRQREQHEAQMEQRRAQAGLNRPQPPYPYPAMPAYGPRYPAAFPGYRTPYWQQPQQ